MAEINQDIKKAKKKLQAKALKSGLYENFGDKEVRQLKDKYPTGYMGEERYNMDKIQEFEEWSRSVDDNTIKEKIK